MIRWAAFPMALLVLCPLTFGADRFGPTNIGFEQVQSAETVQVQTAGPPPKDVLENSSWQVIYVKNNIAHEPGIESVSWAEPEEERVLIIRLDKSDVAGVEPRAVRWTVVYKPSFLVAQRAADKNAGGKIPKGKEDADLYFFGSVLAGSSTKPIYAIDLKLKYTDAISGSAWDWGVEALVMANAKDEPPNDRSQIDPDSIRGALTFDYLNGKTGRPATWIKLALKPAAGEFTRKNAVSNFVPSVRLYWLGPSASNESAIFEFLPFVGFEAGWNLNQPSKLFDQDVDLAGYRGIFRVVPGAKTGFYLLKSGKFKKDDFYRLWFEGLYELRLPRTDEPFVETQFANTEEKVKRIKVTRLTQKPRHFVEVSANVNITPRFGLRAQYRYGSVPPLFEFVDHQVSIGLTFKTNF
jgi:hypothetical protein